MTISTPSRARSGWKAAPALPWTQCTGHRTCVPYGICVVSNGALPGCAIAKEVWSAGCQSCVTIRCANLPASRFITGTTASPSGTASAPPGQKSFCTSTTISISARWAAMTFLSAIADVAADRLSFSLSIGFQPGTREIFRTGAGWPPQQGNGHADPYTPPVVEGRRRRRCRRRFADTGAAGGRADQAGGPAAVLGRARAVRQPGQARARPGADGDQRRRRHSRPAGGTDLRGQQDRPQDLRRAGERADPARPGDGDHRADHLECPRRDDADNEPVEDAAAVRHQLRGRRLRPLPVLLQHRAEPRATERRAGQEWCSTVRTRWWPANK